MNSLKFLQLPAWERSTLTKLSSFFDLPLASWCCGRLKIFKPVFSIWIYWCLPSSVLLKIFKSVFSIWIYLCLPSSVLAITMPPNTRTTSKRRASASRTSPPPAKRSSGKEKSNAGCPDPVLVAIEKIAARQDALEQHFAVSTSPEPQPDSATSSQPQPVILASPSSSALSTASSPASWQLPAAHASSNLLPVPQRLRDRIVRGEFVSFDELLSDSLSSSLSSSSSNSVRLAVSGMGICASMILRFMLCIPRSAACATSRLGWRHGLSIVVYLLILPRGLRPSSYTIKARSWRLAPTLLWKCG